MTTIRVWSPEAERADLVLGESSREMTPAGGGHFEIDVEHACTSCAIREDIVPTLERLAASGTWETIVARTT